VIAVDTSVCMKWFKGGERYEAEAQNLRHLVEKQEVDAIASEILSLEIVRGLKNAQVRQPSLGVADATSRTHSQPSRRCFRQASCWSVRSAM
jgi:predicted nucleic acid-binding protein